MIKKAHHIISSNLMPNLTIDEILISLSVEHEAYRRYCRKKGYDLPPLSKGLETEVIMNSNQPRAHLAQQFSLTMLEVNQCLYPTNKANVQAIELRMAGMSEAVILASCGIGAIDPVLRDKEVQQMIDNGGTQTHIAELYGLTPGRISQIKAKNRKRIVLSQEQRADIKASPLSAKALAKQYNVAVSTIYVIQRSR